MNNALSHKSRRPVSTHPCERQRHYGWEYVGNNYIVVVLYHICLYAGCLLFTIFIALNSMNQFRNNNNNGNNNGDRDNNDVILVPANLRDSNGVAFNNNQSPANIRDWNSRNSVQITCPASHPLAVGLVKHDLQWGMLCSRAPAGVAIEQPRGDIQGWTAPVERFNNGRVTHRDQCRSSEVAVGFGIAHRDSEPEREWSTVRCARLDQGSVVPNTHHSVLVGETAGQRNTARCPAGSIVQETLFGRQQMGGNNNSNGRNGRNGATNGNGRGTGTVHRQLGVRCVDVRPAGTTQTSTGTRTQTSTGTRSQTSTGTRSVPPPPPIRTSTTPPIVIVQQPASQQQQQQQQQTVNIQNVPANVVNWIVDLGWIGWVLLAILAVMLLRWLSGAFQRGRDVRVRRRIVEVREEAEPDEAVSEDVYDY